MTAVSGRQTPGVQLASARSVLFVPGTRPDRFGKVLSSGADAVVLDLEDAVAPEHKSDARQHVVDWLTAHPASAAVRVNGPASPEHAADVQALTACSPLAAVLPKAELVEDLRALSERLPDTPLLPLVETAAGLLAAAAVAGAPGVVRLAFGSVDLQLDLDLADEDVQSSGTPFMTARFWLATASKAAGLAAPLDGVVTAIEDDERLRVESVRARRLGFTGKLCIHPRQISILNQTFSPTAEEIEQSRRVVAAADVSPDGVFVLDGRMVDRPVVDRARVLLQRAHEFASG